MTDCAPVSSYISVYKIKQHLKRLTETLNYRIAN